MRKLFLTSVVSIALCGCSFGVPDRPDRLSDDEIPAFRSAVANLAPYIELRDSTFLLTASENVAKDAGVPEKYYKRIKQELEFTNYLIKEHNRKGERIELPKSVFPLVPDDCNSSPRINKN